jgi:hypothetical protein
VTIVSKLIRPELVIRAAFLIFGASYLLLGLGSALSGDNSSGGVWSELWHHPPLIALVGVVFIYFGLRKRSILATLKGEKKDGE